MQFPAFLNSHILFYSLQSMNSLTYVKNLQKKNIAGSPIVPLAVDFLISIKNITPTNVKRIALKRPASSRRRQ